MADLFLNINFISSLIEIGIIDKDSFNCIFLKIRTIEFINKNKGQFYLIGVPLREHRRNCQNQAF